MPDFRDLDIIIASRVPLLVLETHEEPRALDLLSRIGIHQGKPVFAWSVTEGIRRTDLAHSVPERLTEEPLAVLTHIKENERAGIFVLCDFHPYLGEPKCVRLLKEIAMHHETNGHSIVLLSHTLAIPPEVQRYTAQLQLSMPSEEQLKHLVREEATRWSQQNGGKRVKTDNKTLDRLIGNLRGLSFADARRLIRGAIYDDGAITESDLPELNRAKFQLMAMDEVLSFEYDTANFADVGGLGKLKQWLSQRQAAFLSGQQGDNLDLPKGIMLLGVQGSGKSLAAKAVAGMWGLPLMRLDFGSLYNKYIGETERNLREALLLADTMAPCVLWIDEIEKGLAGDSQDNGTSRRVLGTLLTWMAERRSQTFIVATSNDIAGLPPELVRKGRLDEIFFVDLPESGVRRTIFDIHLKKRFQTVEHFDLERLAAAAVGFSGAEIEQAVVAALYSCAADGLPLNTEAVLLEIENTSPLSVVMAEQLAALRHWAMGRTVPAD